MAKLWNVGSGNGENETVKTSKRKGDDGKIHEYVTVPCIFTGCMCPPNGQNGKTQWDGVCRCGREQYIEHKPGNVYLAMPGGYQFYVIPRGSYFDTPPGMSALAIQAMCPHLVSDEDYLHQQQGEKPKARQQQAAQ